MNILFVTKIYPCDDFDVPFSTDVCHLFTKEWVKKGYNVKVIYTYPIYLRFFHLLAKLFSKEIGRFFPETITIKRATNSHHYFLDGVSVYRIPIFKCFPKGIYSIKQTKTVVNKIINDNQIDRFVPDIIVGHFEYPITEIVARLKNAYKVKGVMVLHGTGKMLKRVYNDFDSFPLNQIDLWGFRSLSLKKQFQEIFHNNVASFMCPSGVSTDFLSKYSPKIFSLHFDKFIYIGSLVKRKNPLSIVKALNITFPNGNFNLSFIGKGGEDKVIMRYIEKRRLCNSVKLYGFIDRKLLPQYLINAECFIMISKSETFGLVYLEAMALGCITIASRNEGIDGIIIDGYNGFLCNAGDYDELSTIIKKIINLPKDEIMKISNNAHKTAEEYSNELVANNYAKALNELYGNIN
jgi:L-malate glycosyltransferase